MRRMELRERRPPRVFWRFPGDDGDPVMPRTKGGATQAEEQETRRRQCAALCAYIDKPSTFDVDAHADEVLQIVDDRYGTRLWTGPDDKELYLIKGSSMGRRKIDFRAPPAPRDGARPVR